MRISYSIRFDAAMSLPSVYGGRTHGHGYTLKVTLEGPMQADGMLMDFAVLDGILKEKVWSRVDHRDLNELMDLPSVENLIVWMWRELAPVLPLAELELSDTPHSAARLVKGDPETLA